jgi:hypothetical protein
MKMRKFGLILAGAAGLAASWMGGDTLTTSANFSASAVINQTAVPEPSSLTLFGSALAGLGWLRRRLKTA